MKKFTAILFMMFFLMAFLAACGGANNSASQSSKGETQVSDTGSQTAEGTQTLVYDESLPSWKQDTAPITINWFVAYDWYGKVFDPENNMADKALLEETGITVNVITGDDDKLNALIASGNLPDVVTFDAVAPQRLQMENAGMVLDLEELAARYAPDFNVPQSMKDWYRNEDGKWYSTISYFYGDERTSKEFGGFLVTHNNNFVRTDILEQIGMTMDDLHTKEGVLAAMQAVKDQKITYDGLEVTPFTGVEYSTDYWSQQFGIQLEDTDGNWLDKRLQPEYLEALKFGNHMYNAGFFTNEEFTQDGSLQEQRIANGQVFFVLGFLPVKQARVSLWNNDPTAQMRYCGQIKGGDSGKPSYLVSSDAAGWTTTMITKDAKYPERIITLFSYLSQETVILDEEFGYDCYDIIDGVVVRKPEKVAEYNENYTAAYNKYNMNLGFLVDYTINQRYENLAVDDIFEQDRIATERDPDIHVYDDKCFYDVEPTAGTDLAAKAASLKEYWATTEPQIIMAKSEQECERLYNEAIDKMNTMGLQELNDYRNQRFKENKERLGLKHAWPGM